MPPPKVPPRTTRSKVVRKGSPPVGDKDEESELSLEEFNEKWPVVLNKQCLLVDEHGNPYAIDQATRANIARHMSDTVYASLPPGCFSDYSTLSSHLKVHRDLRIACYRAGMDIEKDQRRQKLLSGSDSEYEYRESFWWRSMHQRDQPRKHYTKHHGEPRKTLLTPHGIGFCC